MIKIANESWVVEALALLNRYFAGESVSYTAAQQALRKLSAYAKALDPGR